MLFRSWDKEEEEQGQLKKQKEWVKHRAEYKEELGNTNIDDTPIAMAGQLKTPPLEATPVPQGQQLQCTYTLLDDTQGEDDDKDDQQTICQKSELTNMDNNNYIDEEEGDENMSSTADSVKGVAKDGKKNKKHTIGEIGASHNSGARMNKKKKDSTAVETQLITSNEMASRKTIRENGRKRKKGENLQGAVNGMQSDAQEHGASTVCTHIDAFDKSNKLKR